MRVKSVLRGCVSYCIGLVILFGSPFPQVNAGDSPTSSKQASTAKSKKDKERARKLEQELNKPFERWLREDVAYIITDEERQAFQRLQNAEERERFIEGFWENRDPSPDTQENEMKEEHYRRMAYANEHFASGIPGWKTDRGRMYITFGPPDEIESHPSGGTYQRPMEEGGGETSTFPFEKWRYRHIEAVGQDIVIEFVDKTQSGEYRLTIDPSEKDALLHVPGAGLTLLELMGYASKADRFNNTDGTRLGRGFGASSRNNQFDRLTLLANLYRAPARKHRDLQEVVETRLSYDLFPFDVRTDYLRITSDTVLAAVTLQIKVKDMTFQNKEGVEQGVVNIFGRITSLTGRVVQTFEDVVSVDVPGGQLEKYIDQRRVYWQGIPLRAGRYRLNLALKDVQSGNTGTAVVPLQVPRFDDETLSTSSLILADSISRVSTRSLGKGQFVVGAAKVRPSVDAMFARNRPLGIYLEVYNLATDEQTGKPLAEIQYAVLRDGKPVREVRETSAEVQGATPEMVLEKLLPLEGLEPGRYSLQVKVTDRLRNRTIAPAAEFTVQ